MSIVAKRVEKSVELVCRRGCNYVRQVIQGLDANATFDVPELRDLRLQQDRSAVLTELKEIMAVYDDSGNGCCPLPNADDRAAILKKATH